MITPIVDQNTARQLINVIDGAEKVVILSHSAPDGDAVGSSLAMAHMLSLKGKDVRIVVPDMILNSLRTLPGAKEIVDAMRYPDFANTLISEADLIMCLDFNEPGRIDRLADIVLAAKGKKVLIDHHLHPDDFVDITISHPEACATCYLLFHVFCAMGLFADIDKVCAECLLAGMMTDTGNFAYNDSEPDIYIAVAELVRKGADKDRLYKELFNTFSANCLKLNGYALSRRMEVFPAFGAALITLTREELNRHHYVKGDTEGLVNKPLSIPGVVYSAFLREESRYIKVSMRSTGEFPVNEICRDHFGGGGHLNAAGGEFNGTMDEAVDLFKSLLPVYRKKYSKIITEQSKRK